MFTVTLNATVFMLKILKHLHGLGHRNKYIELSGLPYILKSRYLFKRSGNFPRLRVGVYLVGGTSSSSEGKVV